MIFKVVLLSHALPHLIKGFGVNWEAKAFPKIYKMGVGLSKRGGEEGGKIRLHNGTLNIWP